jgi:hypothetical protein
MVNCGNVMATLTSRRMKTPALTNAKTCTFDCIIKVTEGAKVHQDRSRDHVSRMGDIVGRQNFFLVVARIHPQRDPGTRPLNILHHSMQFGSRISSFLFHKFGNLFWEVIPKPPFLGQDRFAFPA